MTTTMNKNAAKKPLSVKTETGFVPEGSKTGREYVPAMSGRPETTEEKETESFANKTAQKAARTEQNFDAANSNLFSK